MDAALRALSAAVHMLVNFRRRLRNLTRSSREPAPRAPPGEETLLTLKWMEAKQKKSELQSELDRPTASRLYGAQVKLWEATRAAGEKCQGLFLKIQAVRNRKRNSKTEK